MNDREFSGLAAGTARAALLVVGVLGLAVGAVMSIHAQEATGGTNSPGGQSVTAYLDYRELNYSIINWGLPVTPRSSAFKKEPVFSGGKVIRGMLQLGGGTSDEMGFAWDRTAGKLYLDLNRNLDLTDDPGRGVFARGRFQRRLPDLHQHSPAFQNAGGQPLHAGGPQFLRLRAG